jgi:C4-type Zn-finger protein
MLINAKDPEMSCPGCRNRMSALDFKPILFTDGLVDVTYVCDWCGMQTKRAMASTAKRMAPAGPRPFADCVFVGCYRQTRCVR